MGPLSATRFDAIVVGAGPGGSTAARRLALAKHSVLLIERDRLPRHKACGGGLTGNVRKTLDFDVGEAVERRVTHFAYVFAGKHTVLHELKGLHIAMVQRHLFDQLLAMKAVEAGAVLLDQAPLRRLAAQNGATLVETPRGTFQAPVVIGADGATSLTARAVGLRTNAQVGIAMDADLVVPDEAFRPWQETALFDFGIVPHGYGWAFPKETFFSIGVGTSDRRFASIRAHLDALIHRHRCLSHPLSMVIRAAPLPFWTQDEPLARGGVFLVGDAAGLVDPLTGEGISAAVRSGVLAAEFAGAWLAGDRLADAGYSVEISRQITRGFAFAQKLAAVFIRYPRLCYLLGVRSKQVNAIFAQLLAGDIDYVELYQQVASSVPGRIARALKPLITRLL